MRARTLSATSQPSGLNDEQIEQFARSGFLVLPGFLPADLVTRLKSEADRWIDTGLRALSIASAVDPDANGVPKVMEFDQPAHGELLTHRPLLRAIGQLLGPRFVFHHMHSDRHAPDLPGKPWHHDYELVPQSSRTHDMVHALHYLDGIDPRMAGLVVLPGSHREPAEKTARAHLGTDVVPGEVFIEELPPGSTVLVHSALFHARRAKPRRAGRPRYFVDASYCQVGAVWAPAKPYWRETLSRARQLGLAGQDWPDLFADEHFSEYVKPE
ncbi:phytanoyl-CoA dioxygenase family protein [Streptomyces sp. NBC_01808]|uniref:phytanoyl-CoA dioxygenase family protein n=1 Tax=Streptomyces sp. NBC_01808 TaxID=2975947 RepID=UPI002DDAE80D|nr:phytanoyl-CoA dioxygenase family protein [Streptomyces sp. NBC_01808]WSA40319.1 phytanoyl-CoA dioxygenase family protein [Streptomyces sp. NBC_01808]